MTLQDFQKWFAPHLEQSTSQFTSQSQLLPDIHLVALIKHVQSLVLTDGKRVRPYLCHVMRGGGVPPSRPAISIYCAVELFHTFCLIHDDVIDHGKKRHGIATLNAAHEDLIRRQNRDGDLLHIANAQAILIGDLLMCFVFNLLHDFKGPRKREIGNLFYEMARRVILGQMLDVDVTTQQRASKAVIEEKMRLKTAEYTFVFPLRLGYHLGHKPNVAIDAFCQDFGTSLGLGYQIQDDLLDILPNNKTKKSSFSDIREGQHTLLTYYILEHGTPAQKKMLRQSWRSASSETKKLLKMFEESGAISYAQKEISRNFDHARDCLSLVKLPVETKENLSKLLEFVANRSS